MNVHVAGLGQWARGHAGPAHSLASPADPAVVEPAASLLDSRLARRTSLLTRMAVEVAAQAAPKDTLARVPMIFASAYGELETMGALLGMLYADGDLSPTRFHNSVTNTALGYLSIALKNQGFSTAVQAGPETVAMALVEAFGLLAERGGDVLVIAADEAAPAPFSRPGLESMAVALYLTTRKGDGPVLENLRQEPASAAPAIPPRFATNPIAPASPLVDALVARRAGSVPLGGWVVDVRLDEGSR